MQSKSVSPIVTLYRLVGLGLALALVLTAVGVSAAAAQKQPLMTAPLQTLKSFAPGVVLVGLRPGADVQTLLSQSVAGGRSPSAVAGSAPVSFRSAKPVFPFAQKKVGLRVQSTTSALARIYRLQLPPEADVMAVVQSLAANPNVAFAEPDYVMRAADVQRISGYDISHPLIGSLSVAVTPNDQYYADQWGLPKIGVPSAWDVTTGVSSTVIAIVDSGLDSAHEDFAGKLWANPGETPGNGVDDDGNGLIDDVNGWNFVDGNNNLADDNGHGTQVAGVAGAASNNGKGIAGVCWNCRLMVVKVMQTSGAVNYSDVAAGVAYAAGQGAHVVNLSLGGYADSATLRTAIESAAQTAVVVAGAGNDNSSTPFYPAAYADVIAVASTDQTDTKATFSNYGAWVDAAAPGVNIKTTFAGGNSYGNENGTSLSAPFVAGLAGLIKSQHPDWSAQLVRAHIINTATAIDALNPTYAGQLGRGRINAGVALTTSPQPQMSISDWALDSQSGVRPTPGQVYQLALTLDNTWLPVRNLTGVLSTSDPNATVTDASGAFGDVNTGQSRTNSADTFGISVSGGAPYNYAIPFTLNLSGSDGYNLSLPFTLTVRSGEEILGNTIYTADEVWTSDKTYIVQGTVIVNPGVTLTIQPGTLVKAHAGKFLRIDGTLIASGTASSPIVFTAITTTNWSGLKFTDSSIPAVFDVDDNYASGSILRYVDISRADTGVNMTTRTPYVADSTFQYNTTAINSGSNGNGGSPRIERNTFTGNGTAIGLSGGQAVIQQNTFTGNSTGINGSGAPQIISNTLASNTSTAINMTCCSTNAPVIRDNRIVGNGGGIYASSLQAVEIEHNLIANNGGSSCPMPPCGMGSAAVSLDVSSAGNSQSSPALAYNPDQDEYLLTWVNSYYSYYQVRAMRVLSDGQPIGAVVPVGIAANNMSTMIPSVAYNLAQREYLVAWTEGASGRGVLAQRVSGNGSLLGSSIVVTNTPTGGNIRVVHQSTDSSYLVVWQDTSTSPNRLYARRVMTDGTPSGDIIAIGSEVSNISLGDVAYDPGNNRSLVIFRGEQMGTMWPQGIFGAWVTSASASTVSAFMLTQDPQNANLYNPAVAFASNAGLYWAAWERQRWDSVETRRIYGQVGVTPVTPTVVYSSTLLAYAPRVAYGSGNNQFLTVWYHSNVAYTDQSIYGQRVYTDGTLVGSPIAISTPGSNGRNSPVLAYNTNRDEYLVVWVDLRGGMGMLYGQRLNANGQLLDNAWTTADETNPAVNFRLTEGRGVRYNTIINNSGYGVQLGGSAAGSVLLAHNNWFGNKDYDVYLNSGLAGSQNYTVTAASNYWGIPTSQIPGRIHDCTFDENSCNNPSATLGKVAYSPALTSPDQTAPAFVRSASVTPLPLGIQRGTFEVNFSRPMITTTLPSLSFHDARRGTIEALSVLSASVTSMAQDAVGRLWFGTNNPSGGPGAVRYDGQNWATFTISNSGLGDNNVTSMFGASNGDMWFGHMGMWTPGNFGAVLSRLQGTTWTTYTQQSTGAANLGGSPSIGQDNLGKIWFGDSSNGPVSFDGSTWKRYTAADGWTGTVGVQRIARDARGRMWFSTWQDLRVFDGVSWTTYNAGNGLPFNHIPSYLFADSRGRIWVGLQWSGGNWDWNLMRYAGMYDGTTWTFYSPSSTNGMLNCSPTAIAEDPDGRIWMSGCNNVVIFDGVRWTSRYDLGSASPMLLDSRGNLWMGGGSTGLRVLWGGVDYPIVDNGQWISSTLYRATYDVTPLVPKGTYAVNAEEAAGTDGMDIAPYSTYTFTVYYAGAVSDSTPPTKPVVSARNDGSLTTLSFNWSSTDPESGIDQYKYALGTTSGGRDVVDWTYVAKTTTSVNRTGLLLVSGQTYYVTMAARNTNGLWSENGVSNPVVAGVVTPDHHYVYLPVVTRNP